MNAFCISRPFPTVNFFLYTLYTVNYVIEHFTHSETWLVEMSEHSVQILRGK